MPALESSHTRGFSRIAGLLYLIIAVAGGYAILYVPSVLQVAGDPTQTVANIAAQRGLYLSGLLGDTVMMLAEIALTAMLYTMFLRVNPTLSLAAALARFAMVAVMAAMLFFHAAALHMVAPDAALGSFTGTQRAELAALFLYVNAAGVWIWQIFFTAHLLILGMLVLRSNMFPRLFGYGLSLGAVGYVLDTLSAFAFPNSALMVHVATPFLLVVTLAEIGFALWLVFVGPKPRTTDIHGQLPA